MLVTLAEIVTVVSFPNPKHKYAGMCSTLLPKVISTISENGDPYLGIISAQFFAFQITEVQSENARPPMFVTLSGIVTEVKEEQPWKTQFPMLVTLLGMATEVKEEQP